MALLPRNCILTGLSYLTRQPGWKGQRTEEEVLPHLWQQIDTKYVERRLLAAEGVGLLCPHVSRDMRASFLLSICQQLVSDNETAVVVMAVHSLAVILNTLEDDVKLMKAVDQLDQALDKHSFQADIISALATSLLPVLAVKSASALTEKNAFEKVLGKLLENLHFVTQMQERIKLVEELLPLAAYTLVGHNPGHSQVF